MTPADIRKLADRLHTNAIADHSYWKETAELAEKNIEVLRALVAVMEEYLNTVDDGKSSPALARVQELKP